MVRIRETLSGYAPDLFFFHTNKLVKSAGIACCPLCFKDLIQKSVRSRVIYDFKTRAGRGKNVIVTFVYLFVRNF